MRPQAIKEKSPLGLSININIIILLLLHDLLLLRVTLMGLVRMMGLH
jgi:hypothetical protein